ncbi:MAG TPA: ATP-binding protein [Candidatus Angelobacter sp.]|jgi:PAS domain S-box-containing protein|nr:ATP-binding protein [Candidatus Angelobacter sp.]
MHGLLHRLAGVDLYREHPALRYGLALFFVLAALAANFMPIAGQRLPFFFFFGAVALTARLCGFGPAIMASLLSGILANFFFLPPYFSFRFEPVGLLQVFLFFMVSLLITSVALQKSVAETAAMASQSQLAETLRTITEGFISYSTDWTITYVNPTGARLCGSTPEQMIGRNLWLLFPDLDGTAVDVNYRRAVREQTTVHFEMYYPPLSRWYDTTAYPGPNGLTAIFQDISESRQTREALRTTERRLQFAQVSARLGSWEWNVKTNELWWADGIWLLHGRSIGSVEPTFENWMAFIEAEDRDAVQQTLQQALAGKGEYDTQYRTTFPDGSVHWIGARGRTIFDEAGQPERMLGVGMDITSNKLAEDSLRKSEKLAAAGRLAATIAHEINNPLEAVTNLLYLLRLNDTWNDEARGYVSQAEHELARIAHVARQTLGFYRDTTSPRRMDLSKIVEESLFLYLPRIQARSIQLFREYDESVHVTGLMGEIRQVISNLVANAIDALPDEGTLRIRVHQSKELNNSNRPGGRIVIADNGSGISPEHRKKLFEPFYTTKQDVGTGLGLWVSQEIVQKHGGSITLRSCVVPGHSGTVFSIFLPE